MRHDIASDALGWDTVNWSQALRYWDRYLPDCHARNLTALELGVGVYGGLSLWLALKGFSVTCSGIKGVSDSARRIHEAYGVEGLIEYQRVDATRMQFKSAYDIVCYRSLLGGIVKDRGLDIARDVTSGIHRALRPGGHLFLAESMSATSVHRTLRSRYGAGKNLWRYFTIEEIVELHREFHLFAFMTTGFLGCFGIRESQRCLLGRTDQLLFDRLVPDRWKYILAGVAVKEKIA